uniref:NYN domain-containing protein n=1 Tax=Aureoumbra lagunensis TaxID=44058 RepID=A0A7S3JU28_9STRA
MNNSVSNRGVCGLFWDLENTPVTGDVAVATTNLKKELSKYGYLQSCRAYADLSRITAKTREHLHGLGIALTDVPGHRKEAADKAMIVDMFTFALDNSSPATIVLISGDGDFSTCLSRLRDRGYHIILIHPNKPQLSNVLMSAANQSFAWTDIQAKTIIQGTNTNNNVFQQQQQQQQQQQREEDDKILAPSSSEISYTNNANQTHSMHLPLGPPPGLSLGLGGLGLGTSTTTNNNDEKTTTKMMPKSSTNTTNNQKRGEEKEDENNAVASSPSTSPKKTIPSQILGDDDDDDDTKKKRMKILCKEVAARLTASRMHTQILEILTQAGTEGLTASKIMKSVKGLGPALSAESGGIRISLASFLVELDGIRSKLLPNNQISFCLDENYMKQQQTNNTSSSPKGASIPGATNNHYRKMTSSSHKNEDFGKETEGEHENISYLPEEEHLTATNGVDFVSDNDKLELIQALYTWLLENHDSLTLLASRIVRFYAAYSGTNSMSTLSANEISSPILLLSKEEKDKRQNQILRWKKCKLRQVIENYGNDKLEFVLSDSGHHIRVILPSKKMQIIKNLILHNQLLSGDGVNIKKYPSIHDKYLKNPFFKKMTNSADKVLATMKLLSPQTFILKNGKIFTANFNHQQVCFTTIVRSVTKNISRIDGISPKNLQALIDQTCIHESIDSTISPMGTFGLISALLKRKFIWGSAKQRNSNYYLFDTYTPTTLLPVHLNHQQDKDNEQQDDDQHSKTATSKSRQQHHHATSKLIESTESFQTNVDSVLSSSEQFNFLLENNFSLDECTDSPDDDADRFCLWGGTNNNTNTNSISAAATNTNMPPVDDRHTSSSSSSKDHQSFFTSN